MKKLFYALLCALITHTIAFSQAPPQNPMCPGPITVVGPEVVCVGTKHNYETQVPGATWTVTGGFASSGFYIREITWTTPGIQTITVTCGDYSDVLTVNVGSSPQPPATSNITGNATVCANATSTYSVTLNSSYTHEWRIEKGGLPVTDLNTTISSNQLTVDWEGQGAYVIYAFLSNSSCTGPVKTIAVNVQSVPTLTIEKLSSNSCTYVYGAMSEVPADSYHWTVSGGASFYTVAHGAIVTWPGPGTYNITVYGQNSCAGTGPVATFTEVVGAPPVLPAIIRDINNGTTSCVGTTERFRVEGSNLYDTYNWTISGGGTLSVSGNVVDVTWIDPGSHVVTASVGCFTTSASVSRTQNVGQPPTIGPITTPEGMCANIRQTYYIEPIAGATAYSWNAAGSNFSGTGTPSQPYEFAAAGTYTIGVKVWNAYCQSERTQSVTIGANTTTVSAPSITGLANVCISTDTNVPYSASAGTWRVDDPTKVTLTPQPPASFATANFHSPGQVTIYFYYTAANGCTSPTAVKSVTARNNPPTPSITPGSGSFTACQDEPVIYSTESGMQNYFWEALPSDPIVSGQGSNAATVRWQTPGPHTIRVNYHDGYCYPVTPGSQTVTVFSSSPSITPGGPLSFCSGGSVALSANTGTGYTYQWHLGGTLIPGEAGSTYTADTPGNYTVQVTTPQGCSKVSNIVTIAENAVTAGVITPNQTICSGGDPTAFGGSWGTGTSLTYQWQSSTDNISFTNMTGVTQPNYDVPAGLTQTTYYRRIATSTLYGVGCSATSNVATVTINNVSAGAISGDQTVCYNGDPVAFTQTAASTGTGALTYQWQASGDGVSYTNLSGQTGQTYDVPPGLSATTHYRRITRSTLNSILCEAISNSVVVAVNSVTSGSISGNETICSGGDPIAFAEATAPTASGSITYQWQSSANNSTFTNISNATSPTYDVPSGVTATTYFRRVVTSTMNAIPCSAPGNTVTITVNNISAGSIAASQTVCTGGDPVAFSQSSSPAGSNLTYQWQSSADNNAFTDIASATGSTYNAPPLSATTYYRRLTTSTLNNKSCSALTNTLTVTVNLVTSGAIAGSQTICSGVSPVAFTQSQAATGTGSLRYVWYYSANGSSFSPISGATGTTYDEPLNLTAPAHYYRVAISGLNGVDCASPATNTLSVAINNVTGGGIAGGQTICSGTDPAAFTETTASTGSGSLSYEWRSSTDGTNFNTVAGTGTALDETVDLFSHTYYRRYTTSTLNGNGCTAASNIITIYVNTVTAGAVAASQTICSGADPAGFYETTAATGTNLSYQWRKGWDKLSMANISGATGTTYDSPPLQNSGMPYYFDRIAYSTLNGVQCSAKASAVSISVVSKPSVTAYNNSVCKGQAVALTGSPTGGTWSGPGVSGSTFYSSSLAVGNYTVNYSYTNSSGCTASASAVITVKAVPNITSMWGPEEVCPGNTYSYQVYVSGSGHTFSWYKPPYWTTVYEGPGYIYLEIPYGSSGYGTVTASVTKDGCTAQRSIYTYHGYSCGYSYYSYSAYPNPADKETTLEVSSAEEADMPVKVYSQTGILMKTSRVDRGHNRTTIDTSDLPDGIYLIEVVRPKGKSEYKRLVVSH